MTRPIPRRHLLAGGLACALPGVWARPAEAHTLYGQWLVYRQKHLLIVCHRKDPAAYPLAKDLEAALATHLPQARARIARAPFAGRIASLLATGQMSYALVAPGEAAAMAAAVEPFAPYGAVETRLVAGIRDHVLVCTADVPAHHAWLLRSAIVQAALPAASEPALAMAWHPGAAAHDAGLALDMLPGAAP